MSTPFINPYSAPFGQLWETLLYEIALAFEERKAALSLPWMGDGAAEWSPTATYWSYEDTSVGIPGKTCLYNGRIWLGVQGYNTGNTPGIVSAWWRLFTPSDTLEWTEIRTYHITQKTRRLKKLWESLQDNNVGHEPDEEDSEWWKEIQFPLVDAQDVVYWQTMQNWLEANCAKRSSMWSPTASSFINHNTGPLNPEESDFLYFSVETWRAVVGLNSSGFRRSRDDGKTFEYGVMQWGDHIGPWIFEDLQKGFSGLQNVNILSQAVVDEGEKNSGGTSVVLDYTHNPALCACNVAYNAAMAGWPSAFTPPTYPSSHPLHYVVAAAWNRCNWYNYRWHSSFAISRRCAKLFFGYLYPMPLTMDLYVLPSGYDFDGLGCTSGKFFIYEAISEEAIRLCYTTEFIGKFETNPISITGLNCTSGSTQMFEVASKGLLAKWNFTNQNT